MTENSCPPRYAKQLTDEEINRGEHRQVVGGMWDEIGLLQFELLCSRGLRPEHRLLDVGCGSLRGGLHFIRYLEVNHYYGIDSNASLIHAGRDVELVHAGLTHKAPNLLIDGDFSFEKFDASFDFALALSVFTHLPLNSIQRCLVNMASALTRGGRFFATYFPSPSLHRFKPVRHKRGVITHGDRNPYHYHVSVFEFLVTDLPLAVTNIGAWSHPRKQHVLEFTRTD